MALRPPPGIRLPPHAKPTKHFGDRVKHRSDVIISLVRARRWTHGVEIGTGEAFTTSRVLSACPGLRFDTCDPYIAQPDNVGPETWSDWPHSTHYATAKARLAPYRDRCVLGRRASADFVDGYAPGSLDFVFIDGDHGTDAVVADIERWRPKLRAGGMMLGHDINWPTVETAVARCLPGYWIGPDNVWGAEV